MGDTSDAIRGLSYEEQISNQTYADEETGTGVLAIDGDGAFTNRSH